MRKICIIGIDGSGKTSHLKLLKEEFRERGKSCKYINLRGLYFRFFSFPLVLLQNFTKREQKSRYLVTDNSFLRNLWLFLFFLDISILAFCRGFFFSNTKYLLSDRGVIDSAVDLAVYSRFEKIWDSKVFIFFKKLLNNNLIILLDIDEDTGYKRRSKFEKLNLETLKAQRKQYHIVAEKFGIAIINSADSFDKVHQKIKELVLNNA